MISIYVPNDVCRIMTDSEWTISRLNALFGLGFTYADSVVISNTNRDEQRYALKCVSLPLQLFMQSFLLPFGWTEEAGMLLSPQHSCLSDSDIAALIENSRKSFPA